VKEKIRTFTPLFEAQGKKGAAPAETANLERLF
jgi:hypothetical protein